MATKILIVEDNKEFRIMLKTFLEKQRLGLEVYEASSGEMGVAKSSFIKPDIILMDINLPNANGLEATVVLKDDNPTCEVIIITMLDTKYFKKMSQDMNVSAFIAKSDIYEKLVPEIKSCIEKGKMKV